MADIGNSVSDMFEFGVVEYWGNPIILWKPVIESDFGQERFLTQDPIESFKKGDFMRVPILTGINKHEFLHPAISEFLFHYSISNAGKFQSYFFHEIESCFLSFFKNISCFKK